MILKCTTIATKKAHYFSNQISSAINSVFHWGFSATVIMAKPSPFQKDCKIIIKYQEKCRTRTPNRWLAVWRTVWAKETTSGQISSVSGEDINFLDFLKIIKCSKFL